MPDSQMGSQPPVSSPIQPASQFPHSASPLLVTMQMRCGRQPPLLIAHGPVPASTLGLEIVQLPALSGT